MWVGWLPSNVPRLYDRLTEKAACYGKLVDECGIAYIIAVFSDFKACVDIGELQECLLPEGSGLFAMYPAVSGVLFFEESVGRYRFQYIPNPQALRPFDLPCGVF